MYWQLLDQLHALEWRFLYDDRHCCWRLSTMCNYRHLLPERDYLHYIYGYEALGFVIR